MHYIKIAPLTHFTKFELMYVIYSATTRNSPVHGGLWPLCSPSLCLFCPFVAKHSEIFCSSQCGRRALWMLEAGMFIQD